MTDYSNQRIYGALLSISDLEMLTPANPHSTEAEYASSNITSEVTELELIEPVDTLAVRERKISVHQRYSSMQSDVPLPVWSPDDARDMLFSLKEHIEPELHDFVINLAAANTTAAFMQQPSDCDLLKKRGSPSESVTEDLLETEQTVLKSKKAVSKIKREKVPEPPTTSCNCSKSKCLRLYCKCFSLNATCGPSCNCVGCHNSPDFAVLRDLVVQETIEKNPVAFKSKFKAHKTKTGLLHSRGCNCSKTNCLKEYCECFKAGTGCSRLCKCRNCKNSKIEIAEEEVGFYVDKVSRKRRNKNTINTCFNEKVEILKKLAGHTNAI